MNKPPHRLAFTLAAALIAASACTPPVSVTPTPSAGEVIAPPIATAGPAGSPQVTAAPALGAPVPGLSTSGLGQLRGDWVFAVRESIDPPGGQVRVEVLAMPLEGGAAPGVVASYLKAIGGVPGPPPPEVLARQFSPDGRRLALNTDEGIAMLDLATGRAFLLAQGQDPVWGSGDRIAFTRYDRTRALGTPPMRLIIDAKGGPAREDRCGSALAWTYDGSWCVRAGAGGIVLDSPDGGAPNTAGWSVRFGAMYTGEVALSVRPQDGATQIAVASTDLPRGPAVLATLPPDPSYEHRIEVLRADGGRGGGSSTVVARETGRESEVRFAEPRWNPEADQLLYRITGTRRSELRIVELANGTEVVARTTGVPRAAEWTPNGEQIVYLAGTHPRAGGRAIELRAVRPISGRDERVLLATTGESWLTSVAARGYGSLASVGPGSPRVVSSPIARADAPAEAAARAAKAIDGLATDLYGELAKEPGNLVFSPYSVAAALAMTRAGAAGETLRQMDEVLHVDLAADLDEAMNALDQALARRAGSYPYGQGTVPLELATANQLWGQQGAEFGREFLDRLASHYGAGVRIVDYVNATEDARVTINEWVSERTKDRIPELIEKDVLNSDTRLVLTNAIYLKAKWHDEFSAARPAPFHRLDKTTVEVPLMRRNDVSGYSRGADHHVVELSYVGGLSMLVIVPDTGSFAAVEERFHAAEGLRALTTGLRSTRVNLGLPRFEVRSAVRLGAVLRALGMPIAFTEQADFSKMSPREPVLIQDVVHQGFIAVDEQGTEAAAATAVIGGATGGGNYEVVELTVDRPFLYLIRDNETGAILFMGRVLEP